ncbi:hypothetical protein ADL27_45825, partial [Streptomyces sp. NRRL F-6602]
IAVGPDRTPILTLPGNPVSSYVSFELFVRPAIRAMMGLADLHRPVVRATLLPPHVPHNGSPATAHGFRKRVLYLDLTQLGPELPPHILGFRHDRLPDHLDVRHRPEQHGETLPHHHLVVGDQ